MMPENEEMTTYKTCDYISNICDRLPHTASLHCKTKNTFMTEKLKKIDREFVLSDSSVNEYGFRLLTEGYQAAEFKKNPIGYYMHRRDEGIALKWDDLRVDGDSIVGKPVINLSNSRGEQICDEAENGFLNAASMGHIVVLEYSTDAAMMLPNQTGPTVTKWYNKECSLVDIPGNGNALGKLYDQSENEINLADFSAGKNIAPRRALDLTKIFSALQLTANADEQAVADAVQQLVATADAKELELQRLRGEKQKLQQQIDDNNRCNLQFEVSSLLERAIEDRKITNELLEQLRLDYAENPTGLKTLLVAMPAYRSIAEQLRAKPADNAEILWNWDDYEQNDRTGKKLKELRANNPDRYKEIFEQKFGGMGAKAIY
jgi:hypothetical protein